MKQFVFGHIKEEVPGRFLQIARTEVDVSGNGTVYTALHLTCSGKGKGGLPRAHVLIGRYVENVVCVGHPRPVRGWVTHYTVGWLLTITLDAPLQNVLYSEKCHEVSGMVTIGGRIAGRTLNRVLYWDYSALIHVIMCQYPLHN